MKTGNFILQTNLSDKVIPGLPNEGDAHLVGYIIAMKRLGLLLILFLLTAEGFAQSGILLRSTLMGKVVLDSIPVGPEVCRR